jgi:hypothetical protein
VKRLFKLLFILVVVGAVLTGMSYVGARATVGQFLGSGPPLSERTIQFASKSASGAQGTPVAWVFTYHASTLPGTRRAEILVSPTGKILATEPSDLERRLERWERSKLPEELR